MNRPIEFIAAVQENLSPAEKYDSACSGLFLDEGCYIFTMIPHKTMHQSNRSENKSNIMKSSSYSANTYSVEESNLTAKLLPPEDNDVVPVAEAQVTEANDANGHTSNVIPLEEDGTQRERASAPPLDWQDPPQAYIVDDSPPPNAPPGGTWGNQRFRGRLTAAATVGGVLVACLPGLLMLIFQLDERDAYLAKDGNLYDVEGKLLGSSKDLKFVPVKSKSRGETRR